MKQRMIIGILVVIGVLIASSFLFTDIVFYLVLSLVLATILTPITDLFDHIRIGRFNCPRVVGVLFSFGLLFLFFYIFLLVFIPVVYEQVDYFSKISPENTNESLTIYLDSLEKWLKSKSILDQDSKSLGVMIQEFFVELIKKIKLKSIFASVLGATSHVLVALLAVSFITFFLLLKRGLFRDLLLMTVPNSLFELVANALFKIKVLLTNYLFGLFIQMIIVFTLVSFILSVLGIEHAMTIGIFAAFANLIPYVGPFLGVCFALLVTLTTGDAGLPQMTLTLLFTKVAITFAIVQLTDNLLLQPIIFSKSVKAHPLEIFVIIFVGASLSGAIGMVLAIPVYTVLKVMYQEFRMGYKEYKIFRI